MEPLEKAAAKERQRAHAGTAPGKHSWKVSTSDAGKTRDKVGAFAGVSGRTVEKIRKVCAAAETNPAKFGPVAKEMDRTGKVDAAYRKVRQAEYDAKQPIAWSRGAAVRRATEKETL